MAGLSARTLLTSVLIYSFCSGFFILLVGCFAPFTTSEWDVTYKNETKVPLIQPILEQFCLGNVYISPRSGDIALSERGYVNYGEYETWACLHIDDSSCLAAIQLWKYSTASLVVWVLSSFALLASGVWMSCYFIDPLPDADPTPRVKKHVDGLGLIGILGLLSIIILWPIGANPNIQDLDSMWLTVDNLRVAQKSSTVTIAWGYITCAFFVSLQLVVWMGGFEAYRRMRRRDIRPTIHSEEPQTFDTIRIEDEGGITTTEGRPTASIEVVQEAAPPATSTLAEPTQP